MNKIAYNFFIIVLYLWLFYPPFSIFRERLSIGNIISFACVLICMLKPFVFKNFYHKFYKEFKYCIFFLFISLFLIILDFKTRIFTQHLLMIINLFAVIPVLLYYANKHGFATTSHIIRALLIVSCIGAFFTTLCVIDPAFNTYVKSSIIRYDRDSFLFENDFRGFGIASGLTSTYGYIMGFIGALGCFYYRENRWYLFALPFVLVSALLNARTGIIIFLFGFILSFLGRKKIIGSITMAILAIFFVGFFDSFLSYLNIDDSTKNWLLDFQTQTESVATSGNIMDSYQASTLLIDMWVIPDNPLSWMLGSGFYLFRNEHGIQASDVGWINELWYGGLLYLLPLLFLFYKIYKNFRKKRGLWFGLFILITIIIVNTKSTLFPSSVMFYLIMMIFFASNFKKHGSFPYIDNINSYNLKVRK